MLKDKTILVTGSSRGIGATTARLAKSYGANVILHGKTESKVLTGLASELGAKYIFCDVSKESEVKREVAKMAGIDILVNSAGINISKPFRDFTSENWLEVYSVNVFGIVNFCNAVLRGMVDRQYGRIVNISSVKGLHNTAGRAAYSSSKAAVISLTETLAKEYAPHVLVNSVAPGFTDTEMTEGTLSARVQGHIDQTLLKRMAKPEEISEAILFLASEKNSYITGQTLLADGGFAMGGK
jgi:NAD(P)-dependent dehydrogenase (short-subunit alcohol dehydrogenase family)